jgi:hypothetical protein
VIAFAYPAARSAGIGLAAALSPNDRLPQLYHPRTSYVIVPLFALANAGIVLSGSILIATLAFGRGLRLEEAKLGVLTTILGASLVTWLLFRATALLPARMRARALLGTSQSITDLGAPVDPGHGDVRYVWRHLPLTDVHPHAQLAAEAAEATDSADLSGVTGTPTFFINGRRHYCSYDITGLTAAVQAAKAATLITRT